VTSKTKFNKHVLYAIQQSVKLTVHYSVLVADLVCEQVSNQDRKVDYGLYTTSRHRLTWFFISFIIIHIITKNVGNGNLALPIKLSIYSTAAFTTSF